MRLADFLFFSLRLFAGSLEKLALFVFADHVQAEEVGGAGAGARAGHNGDDIAGLDVAALSEQLFGALDHGLVGINLGAEDGGCAPQKVETVDGNFNRAECEDGR